MQPDARARGAGLPRRARRGRGSWCSSRGSRRARTMPSSSRKSARFTSRSSNTASITRSASASAPMSEVTERRASLSPAPGDVQPACRHGAIDQRRNALPPFRRRFAGLLDADHAIAGVERGDRDAGAHQAGADDADGAHGARFNAFDARDFRGRALGEEDMAQRLAPDPNCAASGRWRARRRGRRRAKAAPPRGRAARPRPVRAGRALSPAPWLAAASIISASAAGTASAPVRRGGWPTSRRAVASASDNRSAAATASTMPSASACPRRRQRAGGDQLDGGRDAGEARQALRAAGARHDAELHLGQAELRFPHGDAAMAGQRDLQPAAECRAVDRGDDRLLARLDALDHVGQDRLGHRRAELLDVGAADEVRPAPVTTTAWTSAGVTRVPDRGEQAGAHVGRGGVDRRVVDRDHQHAVDGRRGNGGGEFLLHKRRLVRNAGAAAQSGTTAVAWISTLARSSIRATTWTAAMAG